MALTLAERLEKLADLDKDGLKTLLDDLLDAFNAADQDTNLEQMVTIRDQIKDVRAQGIRLDMAADNAAAEEAATKAKAKKEEAPKAEETPKEPEAAADPAPVETAEAPAAAPEPVEAPAPAPIETVPAAAPAEAAPVAVAAGATIVRAGADIAGFPSGYEFQNAEEFGKALAKRIDTVMRMRGGDGEKVVIASLERTDIPADRVLSGGDAFKNWERIEEVIHPDAITASGGCCAPLVTKYDLFDCGGVTNRPVKDALAGFKADRGGIRFYKGPALADLQGALGFWTCADDDAADPEDPQTWKVCARIDCPPEQTAELQAITMCLTFGVLQTRIFPEVAVTNNKLAMVAQARLADAALLAQIKAGSLAITDSGTPLGAVRDLLDSISRAVYYYRDRYRLDKNVRLRAILPQWLPLVLRGDIIKGPFEGSTPGQFFGISEDEIATFFSNLGVNPTWSLDSSAPATNGGGFLTAATTALPAWPTSVQWALFPEGTWLFLDGGNLDIGVVRDSTLVRVNDYMEFSETFEAAANIGCESMWITSTIDVSGKAQGPIVG